MFFLLSLSSGIALVRRRSPFRNSRKPRQEVVPAGGVTRELGRGQSAVHETQPGAGPVWLEVDLDRRPARADRRLRPFPAPGEDDPLVLPDLDLLAAHRGVLERHVEAATRPWIEVGEPTLPPDVLRAIRQQLD